MVARSVDYVVVKHKIARVETTESVHYTEEIQMELYHSV